jgi:alpha-ketoglutarate-dependent taurine dioxygenase
LALSIRQLAPTFAGEAMGIDCRKPLSPDEVAGIHTGMAEHAVLVFRDQKLTDEEQLHFTLHAREIEDMPLPHARMLLLDLTQFATRERFVYTHAWRVNDLVMWDNRARQCTEAAGSIPARPATSARRASRETVRRSRRMRRADRPHRG